MIANATGPLINWSNSLGHSKEAIGSSGLTVQPNVWPWKNPRRLCLCSKRLVILCKVMVGRFSKRPFVLVFPPQMHGVFRLQRKNKGTTVSSSAPSPADWRICKWQRLLSKDKQNEHGANICFNHPLMSMCSSYISPLLLVNSTISPYCCKTQVHVAKFIATIYLRVI